MEGPIFSPSHFSAEPNVYSKTPSKTAPVAATPVKRPASKERPARLAFTPPRMRPARLAFTPPRIFGLINERLVEQAEDQLNM